MGHTLEKTLWRSDAFWTNPLVYKSFLARIPLFLDTYALMKSQYWPRERLDAYQMSRLRDLFRDAPNVPFWRDVFRSVQITRLESPLDILRALPVVSKGTLAALPLEYVSDSRLLPRSDEDHTSGSTGRPFHFYFDWRAGLRSFAFTERAFRTATKGIRYPIVYLRSRSRNGFTFYKHVWFFLRGHHGVRDRMHELQALGVRLSGGFVLYGYTSSVLEVVRQMAAQHIRLPLKAVCATGESIGASDAFYIEHVTGAPFVRIYASREAGYLAFECEMHRLHINEEWAYVETVDENGSPVFMGKEGRIVVTTFDNRVMPFIRYELGDRGVISSEQCSCGRTLRTIEFRGRSAELIQLADGRVVSLLDITSVIDRFWDDIRQFQIIQKGELEFVMRIVPGPSYGTSLAKLELVLRQLMHPATQFRWETVDAIPEAKSGKAVYFVREFEYKQ